MQSLAVLKVCARSLWEETKMLELMKKQQETATAGRLSLLNINQVKLIRYHRALSCILLNYSNLKWFLSRWKFLAAAVNRKRKWLGAMIFNKNVTSYYSELCSPIVFPVNNLPHSLRPERDVLLHGINTAAPLHMKVKHFKWRCCWIDRNWPFAVAPSEIFEWDYVLDKINYSVKLELQLMHSKAGLGPLPSVLFMVPP